MCHFAVNGAQLFNSTEAEGQMKALGWGLRFAFYVLRVACCVIPRRRFETCNTQHGKCRTISKISQFSFHSTILH